MQVLLIDDDPAQVAALTTELHAAGFGVVATSDPAAALTLATQRAPAFILLNAWLADGQTLELLRALRSGSAAVVIMLVGQGNEAARMRGLELGADDYVRRPVSARELGARIRARLQHHSSAPAAVTPAVLSVGPLTLDATSHTVEYAGEPLALSLTEFRLLQYLMAHAGAVVPFATLLRAVCGYQDVRVTDVVRPAVYRLRQKLRDDPADPHLLHTIPGVGFLLRADPAPPRPETEL